MTDNLEQQLVSTRAYIEEAYADLGPCIEHDTGADCRDFDDRACYECRERERLVSCLAEIDAVAAPEHGFCGWCKRAAAHCATRPCETRRQQSHTSITEERLLPSAGVPAPERLHADYALGREPGTTARMESERNDPRPRTAEEAFCRYGEHPHDGPCGPEETS